MQADVVAGADPEDAGDVSCQVGDGTSTVLNFQKYMAGAGQQLATGLGQYDLTPDAIE
jgi:hypothetical protein